MRTAPLPRRILDRARGFTLVELMIVLAVVSILAAIAYPIYTNQLLKAQRVEARTALMRAAQLLERSFTQNAGYPTTAANFNTLYGLGASATVYSNPDRPTDATQSRYTITYTPGALAGSGTMPLAYTLTATPLARAISDPKCGNFAMNERGQRWTSVDDTAGACWR